MKPSDSNGKLRMAASETVDDLARRIEREQRAVDRVRESRLETSAVDLRRIGSVPYLNAVPLTRGIEDRIVMAHPSELALMLREQRLDAALVSVAEVLLNDGYDILDGIAIASLGEVKSVLLAHRQPLDRVQEVFCDQASITSVQLLRVLLAERGLRPAFKPLPDYHRLNDLGAVLLIGDQALDFLFAPHDHAIWDLGAAWYEMTNLPFVYAVWALRRSADTAAIRSVLREARDFGMDTLEHVIRTGTKYDLDFRRDYLSWYIHYHLGADEKRGLARFRELLLKHGNAVAGEPRFAV